MDNTYTWVIEQLNCYPKLDAESNVVFAINWRINATDGINVVTTQGTQQLEKNLDSDFIEYQNITESIAIDWVKNAMGKEKETEAILILNEQLNAIQNPPIVSPKLPWIN